MINEQHPHWWQSKKGKAHDGVWGLMERLKDRHESLQSQYLRFVSLYENRQIDRYGRGYSQEVIDKARSLLEGELGLTLNIIGSAVDTIVAKIASKKPKPMFLTNGGEFSLQRQARQLEKFVEGTLDCCGGWSEMRRAFVDAAVCGTGFVKVFEDQNEVITERVFPGQIMIDEDAARLSPPREMYQQLEIPAEVLIDRYPKQEKEIRKSIDRNAVFLDTGESFTTDLVDVVEGWHLPSGKGAKDGRHIIAVRGATLVDEPWTEPDFPFVIIRFRQRQLSFLGQGIPEQLKDLQIEINKLVQRVQEAMHLYATAWTFYERGTINTAHIKNVAGTLIPLEPGAAPPVTVTPPSMNNQVFTWIMQLKQLCYELPGVSQLSASSQKPAGVESGIALRTLLDTETMRFAMQAEAWEEAHVCLARKIVECARTIHKHNPSFSAHYIAGKWRETIKWSEVNLDDSRYTLRVYPTNILPSEPTGRLATVEQLLASGLIDPQEAKALLDYPDLESYQTLERASHDIANMVVESLATGGKFIPPNEFMDLTLVSTKVMKARVEAQTNNAPDSTLERFDQWLAQALELMQPPQPPAAAPPIGPGGELGASALPQPEPGAELPPGAFAAA